MFSNLIKVLLLLNKKYIFRLISINIFFIINALVQLLYIASVYPLISLMTNQQSYNLTKFDYLNYFTSHFNLEPTKVYLLIFLIISLVANLCIIISNYINYSFTYNLLTNLRTFFFYNYSKKNYLDITSKNLSFYSITIFQQLDRVVMNIIGSINNLCLQFFLITTLIIPLIIINLKIFLFIFLFFNLIFLIILFFFKNFYKQTGKNISSYLEIRNEILNKAIKNFQEIKIFNIFGYFINKFNLIENSINKIYKLTSFISHSTKPILEIILIILVASLYLLFQNFGNFDKSFLPALGVFIFAFYKLAPSFNSIYASINEISFNKDSIDKIMIEIENFNYKNSNNYRFNSSISDIKNVNFNNICFKYHSSSLETIKDVSLELTKNKIYLLKGISGAGKTTLLNILMGIIKPTSGKILINNKDIEIFENSSWFENVSYVPQKISILSENVKVNISLEFNEERIDNNRILEVLKIVNLQKQLMSRLNQKLNEDGRNLSGGQLQRIGIARALYRDSQIVIFDEPTANLDQNNEEQILDLIYKLKKNKIIIIVSHKNIDLRNIDKTFYLLDGILIEKK